MAYKNVQALNNDAIFTSIGIGNCCVDTMFTVIVDVPRLLMMYTIECMYERLKHTESQMLQMIFTPSISPP